MPAEPACPALREHLEARGYERHDAAHAEAWELTPGPDVPGALRVVLWPRTTRVAALAGPLEQLWTAEFGQGVPAALIAAFLEAAESELTGHG